MSFQRLFSLLLAVIMIFFSTQPWLSLAQEKCHPKDKQALLKIKKSLNNNNESSTFSSWNSDTDCCDWNFITCHPFTNRVLLLALYRDNTLHGRIPFAIGDLPHLRGLYLHNLPNLSGPIPASITKLNRLSVLHISRLNLTGHIPYFLGQLKNLTYLDLSFNNLINRIPSSLSSISGLQTIALDHNRLTGTIPSNLGTNTLFLTLSHNRLSGTIPDSFKDTNFAKIDVSRNELHGDISMLFGATKTTEVMDFSWNKFAFNISNLEIHKNLTYLDLSHNKIYGSIPKAMVDLELDYLDVSYNSLCGKIPQGGSLQKFHYSTYFRNKCLCGAPLNFTCN